MSRSNSPDLPGWLPAELLGERGEAAPDV